MNDVLESVEECDSAGNRFRLREISCPICDVRDLRPIGKRGGRHQRSGLGITSTIVQCRRCALMWPDPFPFPVDPSGLYGDPAKYFGDQDEEVQFRSYQKVVLATALQYLEMKQPSLLDVGSGRAALLRAAQAMGLSDIIGLEFAQGMIDYARAKWGIELLPRTIEQYANTADRTFDVVTFCAVLEHVYDPNAAIAAAARLTRPGALLYLDVPHEPNILTRAFNFANRVRGREGVINLAPTFPPFHVFGFNESSVRKLLAKHGFKIIKLEIKSEMAIVSFPNTPRGWAMKAAAKTIAPIANWTGTAVNMFLWAKRV